jgi:hypothetical protein
LQNICYLLPSNTITVFKKKRFESQMKLTYEFWRECKERRSPSAVDHSRPDRHILSLRMETSFTAVGILFKSGGSALGARSLKERIQFRPNFFLRVQLSNHSSSTLSAGMSVWDRESNASKADGGGCQNSTPWTARSRSTPWHKRSSR